MLHASTKFREVSAEVTRRQSSSSGEPATPVTVGTLKARVRDITSSYKFAPEGARPDLALKLYTDDTALDVRPGDLLALTYQGTARTLQVENVKRYAQTQQLEAIPAVRI